VNVLAGHNVPRSESRGEPPAEVGDPLSQRVKNGQLSATLKSLNSEEIAFEDDEKCDESSDFVSVVVTPIGNCSLRL
jgi:hypothetical protein